MSSDTTKAFRVLIVGGGPVGLALGIMFAKSDIDFLILEQHSAIISDSGASITLWPHGTLNADGSVRDESAIFEWLEEQVLYDALGPENQSKVRTGVGLQDIEVGDNDVRVRLSDGSVETGSIVIGSDGIHSATREVMRRLAGKGKNGKNGKDEKIDKSGKNVKDGKNDKMDENSNNNNTNNYSECNSDDDNDDALITTFQCLYGTVWPPPEDLDIPDGGVFFESRSSGYTTQLIRWENGVHIGLFKRIPEPTRARRTFFTPAEIEAYETEFADIHVTPKVTAGELLARAHELERNQAEQRQQQKIQEGGQQEQEQADQPIPQGTWLRLVQQPEGFATRWQLGGRIVLVGDSAIQVTSAAGLGLNVSLQSAVLLVNKLHATVSEAKDGHPDTKALERALGEYEATGRSESAAAAAMSGRMIRGNVWETWSSWFAAEWLVPWVFGYRNVMRKAGRDIASRGRTLNCGRKTERQGSIPWVN
ncbi:hypothetical protein SLS62_008805 [Diatrype stigma]|uniref:FAD-binding domain-containing protein n=1 Tax=Diatrype stigma TaxID=117547 RepID=A0AAN9UTJ7_9PEZI